MRKQAESGRVTCLSLQLGNGSARTHLKADGLWRACSWPLCPAVLTAVIIGMECSASNILPPWSLSADKWTVWIKPLFGYLNNIFHMPMARNSRSILVHIFAHILGLALTMTIWLPHLWSWSLDRLTCKCFSRLGAWASECAGKYWVEGRIQEYPFCFCSRLSGDLVARYFFPAPLSPPHCCWWERPFPLVTAM